MAIDTSTCINIFPGKEWHYSVEDTNIEVGCSGCTISYWYDQKRKNYIMMTNDEALALADAIYKLFKKNPGWDY